jgi:phage-related protein
VDEETIEIEVHAQVAKLAKQVRAEIKKIEKSIVVRVQMVLDRSGLEAEYKRIQKDMEKWNKELPVPSTTPQSRAPKNSPPAKKSQEDKDKLAAERAAKKAQDDADKLVRAKERADAKANREAEAERKKEERALTLKQRALKKEIADKERSLKNEERVQAKLLREREQQRKADERTAKAQDRHNMRMDVTAATLAASIELAAWKKRQKKLELEVEIKKESLRKVGEALLALSGGRAAGDIVTGLGKKLGNLDRNVPKIAATATAVGGIGILAISSLGGVFALTAALTGLAGIAGLIPAALGASAATGGTLLAAFNGMGKAQSALADAKQAPAGEDPAIAAAAREKSVQAIADAEENAADAIVQANKRVEKSKEDVVKADKNVAKAKKDLKKAYDEESKAVRQLDSDIQHARNNADDAEAAMNAARDALAQAQSDPSSFAPGAVAEMKRELAKATLEYNDQKTAVSDLSDEKAKSVKDGIAGSDRVVAANEAVAEAEKSLKDAQSDAKEAAAERIKVEIDGKRAVSDANKELALSDLRRSAEQNAASNAAKDALAALTPAAAGAALTIASIRDRLGEVRDIAQESFFTGFSEPLERLANTLLPQLKIGVGQLATQMGLGAQALMDSLNSSLGGGVLEAMFGNTATAAGILNGSIAPLVGAFSQIGLVGSTFLPQLAEGFKDMSVKFGDFIAQASADGSLHAWIQGGLDTAKQLGSVLGGLGGILGGIAKAATAAGSGNILGSMGDALGRVADIVNAEPFQSTLTTIFKAAGDAVSNLGIAIDPLASMFTSLAPTLAEVLPLIGTILGTVLGGIAETLSNPVFREGLTTMFSGILTGVQALLPAMGPLGQILGVVMGVVGELAKVLGPILAEVFVALAPLISTLATALMPLIQALGPLLGAAITAVMPMLNLIIGVISSLIPIVTAVVEIVTGLMSGDFTKVFEGVGHLMEAQGQFFKDLFTKLIPGYIGEMVKNAGKGAENFLKFFESIPDGIKNIFIDFFSWVFKAGGTIVKGLMDGIRKAAPALGPIMDSMMGVVSDFLPHSAPPKGPLSGKGWAEPAGTTIPLALAAGMLSKKEALARASNSVMTAIKMPSLQKPGTTADIQQRAAARATASNASTGGAKTEINYWQELGSVRNTLIQKNRLEKRGP